MKLKLLFVFIILHKLLVAQSVTINEVLANNTLGIRDEDNDNTDWIEFYNSENTAVQLQGMGLSDDSSKKSKWIFPNVFIPAKGYLLVYASNKDRKFGNYLHTNFTLDASGEKIYLSAPSGIIINEVLIPSLNANVSYGRKVDGINAFGYFLQSTPRAANNSANYYSDNLQSPNFSLPAGFYPDTINLIMDHPDPLVTIRYTLDGSEPTANSAVFQGALKLNNRASDPNNISLIPTNPALDLTKPNFDTARSDTRGWLPPWGNVFKINVVRVKAFKGNSIASRTVTRTYIIDPQLNLKYNFPLISINTDKENLFDNDSGIYVYGNVRPNEPAFEGNYSYNSEEWARNAYFEYFTEDGNLALERYVTAEMNGNGGRHAPQKSFRFSSRSLEGRQLLKLKFFDDKEISVFDKIILRNGGHRLDCFPRDNLGDKICEGLNMEVPNYKMAVVFINGEYWGLQSVKERFDDAYFQYNYGIRNEEFTMLELKGTITEGKEGDEVPYLQLIDFVSNNDLSIQSNYDYVKTQIDIENYMDFIISESFIGNIDFPNNNTRYWRKKTPTYMPDAAFGHDGRWRWVFYDLDGGFGASCGSLNNAFRGLKRVTSDEPEYINYTHLIRALLGNPSFKTNFINRYADLLNSTFSTKVVSAKVLDEKNKLAPGILDHVYRWRYPSVASTLPDRYLETPSLTKWNSNMNEFLDFASKRPTNDRLRLKEKFSQLSDTIVVTLNVNDKIFGEIKINSIAINAKLDGVNSTIYPWLGTYFKGNPITLLAIPHPGYKFSHWTGTASGTVNPITVNLLGNSTFTAVFVADPNFTYVKSLLINEVNATNRNGIKDPYNENDDWVEIYNPSEFPIDIQGYFLTDDISNLTKYAFPSGTKETIIPPKGFLLVWTDHQSQQGNLHTPFKLRASGERIELTAPDSVTIIDSLSFANVGADISYGRFPNGSDNFTKFIQPSPGASNKMATNFELPIVVNNFAIYPNPVTNSMVYFTKTTDLFLFNALGQLINQATEINQLDVSSLPSGIYYMRNSEGQTAKLVKL
jgi:hypothetical protein